MGRQPFNPRAKWRKSLHLHFTHPESYEPLAQIKDNSEVSYYHCNQIGIPRKLADREGNLLWHASYKGWSKLQGEHNLKGVHQPLRLQNQYFDKETGHTIKSEPFHKGIGEYYDKQIGVKK
ncbi:RHS domain-containing protein [Muribacter muris]|uniref:RHS domain-containing protein n=1 Tax=Muribacter muris TaxID=67855 RepID=UPI00069DE9D1|nr:RHS domain-containing protein [Muribacter muris]